MNASGPLSANNAPKSITIAGGSGSVSPQTGTFSYSYPIAVPPGRAMAPAISLSYSSDRPLSGGLAAGWSLDLPAIERDWSLGANAPERWTSGLAAGRELIRTREPAPGGATTYRAQSDSSFARYQRLSTGAWRVLTTSGNKLFFGESRYMSGGAEDDWMPLTRSVDAFGNEVRYYWERLPVTSQSPFAFAWQIFHIDYTVNEAAGLGHHARVVFVYDRAGTACAPGAANVGSAHSLRSGGVRLSGHLPLVRIVTQVRSNGVLRDVTRYDLTYDDDGEGDCGDTFQAPMRILTSIQATGVKADGTTQTAPAITFTYAERATPESSVSTISGLSELLPRGERSIQGSNTQTALRDVDGDGLLDHARSVESKTPFWGTRCGLEWRKNLGRDSAGELDFGPPRTTLLPTLAWQNGGSPTSLPVLGNPQDSETCSLSGQFSLHYAPSGLPEPPPPDYPGMLLMYQFLDMNRDGISDLVTGLSGVKEYLGGQRRGYSPDSNRCPRLNLDTSAVLLAAPDDPNLPGPLPPRRQPIGAGYCYVWKIWTNQEDGRGGREFSFDQDLHAPSPVFAEAADPLAPPGNTIFGSRQATIDIDGDGYLDFIRVDPARVSTPHAWYVYRFNGTDVETGQSWALPHPPGTLYPIQTSSTGSATGNLSNVDHAMLLDVNGDGLPDLFRKKLRETGFEVFYNNGIGFEDRADVATQDDPLLPAGITEALVKRDAQGSNDAARSQVARVLSVQSLGTPDIFYDTGLPLKWFFVNFGNGALGQRTLLSNDDFAQRTTITADHWKTTHDAMDIDGDGLVDQLDDSGGAPTIRFAAADGAPRGTLTAIDNGRGLTTRISYEHVADSAFVGIGTGKLPRPKWVVTELRSSHAASGTPDSVAAYLYSTPVRTEDDRGLLAFRGFEATAVSTPSGSLTETHFDYATDWSGRVGRTLTRTAAGVRPSSINDRVYTTHHLDVGNDVPLYVFSGRTDAYDCEHLQDGDTATYSEADCRAKVKPRVRFSELSPLTSGSDTFALYATETFDAELIDPSEIDGFFGVNEAATIYTADDYRIVTTRAEKRRGSATDSGGEWVISGARAGVVSHAYDRTLTFLERTCTARGEDDLLPTGQVDPKLGACAAFAYDRTTGQLTKTQRPNQYFEDVVVNGNPALTTDYSQLEYVNPDDPDSRYKVFPVVATNALGHRVVSSYDLGTGASLTSTGPNPGEASYRVIDAFGRGVETWANVSRDPLTYRLTTMTDYHDHTIPQRVTAKQARWLPGAFNYDNDRWIEIRTDYDGLGRPITVTEWDIDRDDEEAVETYSYDAAGNLVTTTLPDPSGTHWSQTVDYVHRYDALGRRTCTTLPNGSGVKTTFGGLVRTTREFGGGGTCADPAASAAVEPTAMKTVRSDVFGRVHTLEEALDVSSTADVATTIYAYDDNNNVREIIRVAGLAPDPTADTRTTMLHDWLDQRLRIDRHGRTWAYAYDRNGNVLTQTSPHDGAAGAYTTRMTYDALDRVTGRLAPPADLTPREIADFDVGLTRYVYDSGNLFHRPLGRLTEMHSPNDTLAVDYRYDALGNMIRANHAVDLTKIGIPFTASFPIEYKLFTVSGKPRTVIHASGIRTLAHFARPTDEVNTMRTTQPGSTFLSEDFFSVQRNASGATTRISHSSALPGQSLRPGRRTEYTYDQLGRVTLAESDDPVAARIRQSFTYSDTSEVVGLSSTVGDLVTPRNFSYGYDDRHQLTRASDDQGFTARYRYQRQGTLASAFVAAASAPGAHTYPRNVTYRYADPASSTGHQDPEIIDALIDVSTGQPYASFDYDRAGSLTDRTIGSDTWAFRYDGANRLRRRTLPNGSDEDYHYADGARWLAARRQGGVVDQLRLWIGASELIYDCTATDCVERETRTTVSIGGRSVLRVEQDPQDERTSKLLHSNGLGHLLGVYGIINDNNGTLDYELEVGFQYGPFGEILEAGSASGASADDYLQRFNGKELDVDSGLSYYGHRYYDPVSLTWNRSDPLYRFVPELAFGDPRSGNLYSFSLNNPVRYVDPDGLDVGTGGTQLAVHDPCGPFGGGGWACKESEGNPWILWNQPVNQEQGTDAGDDVPRDEGSHDNHVELDPFDLFEPVSESTDKAGSGSEDAAAEDEYQPRGEAIEPEPDKSYPVRVLEWAVAGSRAEEGDSTGTKLKKFGWLLARGLVGGAAVYPAAKLNTLKKIVEGAAWLVGRRPAPKAKGLRIPSERPPARSTLSRMRLDAQEGPATPNRRTRRRTQSPTRDTLSPPSRTPSLRPQGPDVAGRTIWPVWD